jgi:hypothetical protein
MSQYNKELFYDNIKKEFLKSPGVGLLSPLSFGVGFPFGSGSGFPSLSPAPKN